MHVYTCTQMYMTRCGQHPCILHNSLSCCEQVARVFISVCWFHIRTYVCVCIHIHAQYLYVCVCTRIYMYTHSYVYYLLWTAPLCIASTSASSEQVARIFIHVCWFDNTYTYVYMYAYYLLCASPLYIAHLSTHISQFSCENVARV